MIRLVTVLAFALLFTVITVRLAFGGLDASTIVAGIATLALWWQVFRSLKRGIWS